MQNVSKSKLSYNNPLLKYLPMCLQNEYRDADDKAKLELVDHDKMSFLKLVHGLSKM